MGSTTRPGGSMGRTDRWLARPMTRRVFVGGLAAAVAVPAVACRGPEATKNDLTTSTMPISLIDFPAPTTSTVALERTFERRRSVREFASRSLDEAEIGQLLWAAQGLTSDRDGRTAPSAGALYPLELHALTPERVVHYVPRGHRGEVIADRDRRPRLMAAAYDQEAVGNAPLVIVIVGVPARTATKYGDRADRYVNLEAGHAAQNLLLQAVALGLGAVPIGGFDDQEVAEVLALPDGHNPRYLVPIGQPR